MSTENLIPISYVKQFTPLVKGDEITNIGRSSSILINEDSVRLINELGGDWFVVSFADRPNTTGKQPVADDVVVDVVYSLNKVHTVKAEIAGWLSEETDTHSATRNWKPNHAAMLAKFKEQGANTMFTFENTKEATHIIGKDFKKIIPGNMPEYLNDDGVWVRSNHDVKWLLTHKGLIELSRPVGERKEDHTIDGILTKAQPQGAKAQAVALTIESLDDNPDEQVKEPESMIGPSEFYQKGGDEQVIEPWVADQLDDLINPVSEGCQAGAEQLKAGVEIGCCTNPKDFGVNADTYHKLPHAINATPGKPVFTQEMSEAGRMPKVGASIDVLNSSKHPMFVNVPVLYISKTMCVVDNFGVDEAFHPHKCYILAVDNRTDKQKLISALSDEFDGWTFEEFSNYNYAKILLESDKFTITLN